MRTFCRIAIIAVTAIATSGLVQAQETTQFQSRSSGTLDGVAKAVYSSLSDMQGPAYGDNQATYQSLNDHSSGATSQLSDDLTTTMPSQSSRSIAGGSISDITTSGSNTAVTQASLLGSSFGLGGPACGIADPSCGITGPACGMADPSCGIGASYGLPSLGGSPSCGVAMCDDGCDSCGSQLQCGALGTRQCPTCCGVGTHYSHVYGEALYLRARSSEVAYGVPVDGPVAAGTVPIQVGNVAVVDSDYDLGFRAGVNLALDTVSSLDIRYTMWENDERSLTEAIAPFALRSLVSHPSTASAAIDNLAATAQSSIELEMIDATYRHLIKCCDVFSANYVIGGRYANLDQGFDVEFIKNGTENVSTDIDFEGGGIRLGLETQRYSCRNQLHVYANGYASFLAGEFRARYFQGQSFDPSVVNSEWEAGRIVPILDFEAGLGWASAGGKLRLNAGYMVSAWFNAVTTQEYVNAIRGNDFTDLNRSIWFDGLQARVTLNF